MLNIQHAAAKKEAYFAYLCKELEAADVLGLELKERLDLQDASDARRRVKLHADWTEQVYDTIHRPINAAIESIGGAELNRRRRMAYQNFLDKTNTNGALFRDIILKSEYDPFADNPPIKCTSVKVVDPCARVLHKKAEEDAIAHVQKKKFAYGRHDNLDVKLWQTGVFESTPHGHFSKGSNNNTRSNARNVSSVHMDHYKVAKGNDAMAAELPRGKRTAFSFPVQASKTQIQFHDASSSLE